MSPRPSLRAGLTRLHLVLYDTFVPDWHAWDLFRGDGLQHLELDTRGSPLGLDAMVAWCRDSPAPARVPMLVCRMAPSPGHWRHVAELMQRRRGCSATEWDWRVDVTELRRGARAEVVAALGAATGPDAVLGLDLGYRTLDDEEESWQFVKVLLHNLIEGPACLRIRWTYREDLHGSSPACPPEMEGSSARRSPVQRFDLDLRGTFESFFERPYASTIHRARSGPPMRRAIAAVPVISQAPSTHWATGCPRCGT